VGEGKKKWKVASPHAKALPADGTGAGLWVLLTYRPEAEWKQTSCKLGQSRLG